MYVIWRVLILSACKLLENKMESIKRQVFQDWLNNWRKVMALRWAGWCVISASNIYYLLLSGWRLRRFIATPFIRDIKHFVHMVLIFYRFMSPDIQLNTHIAPCRLRVLGQEAGVQPKTKGKWKTQRIYRTRNGIGRLELCPKMWLNFKEKAAPPQPLEIKRLRQRNVFRDMYIPFHIHSQSCDRKYP